MKGGIVFLCLFLIGPYLICNVFGGSDKNTIYQNEVIDAYNSIDETDTKESVQRKLDHLHGVEAYVFDGVKQYKYDGGVMDVYCYRWLLKWYAPIKNSPRAYIQVYFDKDHRCVDKDHFWVNGTREHVIEG